MIRSAASRWLDAIERRSPAARLALAWLLCAIPRAAFALAVGPSSDYLYFKGAPYNSYWYPLYTVIARSFWALSQGSVPVYVGLHLVIHALIGPAVYLLAKQLGFSRGGAWGSVLAVAFLPYYVSIGGRQANVGILIALLGALLAAFVHWVQSNFPGLHGILFGVLSFLILTLRPNGLSVVAYLYALALIVAFLRRGQAPPGIFLRRLGGIATSGAFFLSLVAGLAWSNYRATGHFTPFTPNSGYNLWVGNNPLVDDYARRYDIMSLESAVLDHGLPEEAAAEPDLYERDRLLARMALRYGASDPLRTVKNTLLKTLRYWDFRVERATTLPWWWNAAFTLPYLVYGPLAALGGWLMWRRGCRFALAVLAGSLVCFFLPHVAYFGTIRMRMTTEFLLLMLAVWAIESWFGEHAQQ